MKKHSVCNEVKILFIENHWQTKDTMNLHLHHLKTHFRNEDRIGLMLDEAKTHNCEVLQKCIEDASMHPPSITLGFVAKNLTAVCSPPDQSATKALKKENQNKA